MTTRKPVQAGDYGQDQVPHAATLPATEKKETDGKKVLSLWSK